jgi:hypothetical protein
VDVKKDRGSQKSLSAALEKRRDLSEYPSVIRLGRSNSLFSDTMDKGHKASFSKNGVTKGKGCEIHKQGPFTRGVTDFYHPDQPLGLKHRLVKGGQERASVT